MKSFEAKTTKINKGSWSNFPSLCKGCSICIIKCPTKALAFGECPGIYSNQTPNVDPTKCTLCGICEIFCPDCAVRVEKND